MLYVFTISILLSVVTNSHSARILGIVPTPAYSHQSVFKPLWKELSLRGHQLTVLTTHPLNDNNLTNLTEIDLSLTHQKWLEIDIIKLSTDASILELIETSQKMIKVVYETQLSNSEVQALIKNETEQFDLLIVEALYPGMFAFSERFQCPFIGMTSTEAPFWIYEFLGNPTHPVLYPDTMLPFYAKLNFKERLISVLAETSGSTFLKFIMQRDAQEMISTYFGKDKEKYPSLTEISNKMSMLFTNTNPIFNFARPLLPSVIQIGGGLHLKPGKNLPLELQLQLDKAKEGFIYFSLGSNIKSKDLEDALLKTILDTFAELPYLVLWKFELDILEGRPENVIISKWFPQQDIFKHPSIKLFITQGGLQSLEEAIYHHVPIIGIPFIADQPRNVKWMVDRGLGLELNSKTMNKDLFKTSILEVINNPNYKNEVKVLADLSLDQPMTGLEKAVWWTEYVIRYKGAKHFRSPILDLPSYQYYLLDVTGFILLLLTVLIFVLFMLIKLLTKVVKIMACKAKLKTQ